MNEVTKTLTFVGVAMVVVLIAVFAGPTWRSTEAEDATGQALNPAFKNAADATSLQIVEFEDELRQPRPFAVARVDNQWAIPSHQNYPADAEGQLGKAAASLLDLEILREVFDGQQPGKARERHNQYGVIDPEKAKGSDEGVGTRVTVKDKNDATLVSMIIGQQVSDRSELHYVRHVDKDPVYVVKVDPDKLSTKFEDWIEDDLLKLSAWDIRRLEIQDYTVGVLGNSLFSDMKGQLTLEHDDSGDPKWKLTQDMAFDKEKGLVPRKMAEDEELDTDKLDALKSALDDLKIADVQRKPPGLSTDLKVGGSLGNDLETAISLQQRGFYFVPVEVGGQQFLQLLSNKGEVRVAMKDGVEYVLRFGEVAGAGTEKKDNNGDAEKKGDADKTDEAATEDEADGSGSDEDGDDQKAGLNRYLFVMAEFNPDMIPQPELEEPPEENEAAPAKTETPEEDKGDTQTPDAEPAGGNAAEGETTEEDSPKADATEADPMKPDAAEGDGARGEASEPGQPSESGEPEGDQADADPAEDDSTDGNGQATESDTAEADPAEADKTEADPAVDLPTDGDGEQPEGDATDTGMDDGGSDVEKTAEELKAEQERIEKDNQRKREEYDEKIKEGEKKVRELNARFADWYYIISDDVYQKIHLGRDQVVKKKEKKDDEGGDGEDADHGTGPAAPAGPLDASDNLKEEGPGGQE